MNLERYNWGFMLFTLLIVCIVSWFFSGCSSNKPGHHKTLMLHDYPDPDNCPWHEKQYDKEWVDSNSKKLGIRPVDFLHRLNSGKHYHWDKSSKKLITHD